jgi:hypothetical protein
VKFETYLTDEETAKIRSDLIKCRDALDDDDLDAIKKTMYDLENSSYRIAEVMYRDLT